MTTTTAPRPTASAAGGTRPQAGRLSQTEQHAKSRRAITRSADDKLRLMQTGSTKRSPSEKAIAIFSYPGIVTLAACYTEFRNSEMDARGRKPGFPPGVLIATAVLARALGSLPEALGVLRDPPVWARIEEGWESFEGAAPLPTHPPSRAQVSEFRKTLETRVGLLAAFKETFTAMSVRQAQMLGHLLPEDADLTGVDARHTVFGDGVILKPMSDVIEMVNPVTGELEYLGSRARVGTPRVQREVRVLDADHPGLQGINFVALHTETNAGLITLGIESTLQAEQWATLEIMHRVHRHAGDAIHTLVYDGALSGWIVDHLMGSLGVDLVQKSRKRAAGRSPGNRSAFHDDEDLAYHVAPGRIDACVDARSADFLATHHPAVTPSSRATLARHVRRGLRHDVLSRLYYSGSPLPVGTSLYPSNKDESKFDLVESEYELLIATHAGLDGEPCQHDLALDDGALFTIDVDDATDTLVKTAHLPCAAARRETTDDGFGLTREYLVPCRDAHFIWSQSWQPSPTRYTRTDPRPKGTPFDALGRALQTVPRVRTERFRVAERLRNYSESFNNWFELLLPRMGRATSMTQAGQELDFLLASAAMNAFTWDNAAQ